MTKLARYMLTNGSLVICNRKVKPRFFIFICILIGLIITALSFPPVWDKLIEIINRPKVTSVYWKAVFYP